MVVRGQAQLEGQVDIKGNALLTGVVSDVSTLMLLAADSSWVWRWPRA